MKTAVIISTYNQPKALNICLESIRSQSKLPDEIMIADDGSTQETTDLIKKISESFSVSIKHVWHPDEGFQRTKILNKAITEYAMEGKMLFVKRALLNI